MNERRTKDFPFKVKAVTDTGELTCYASVFGNIDKSGDIIAPGAFTRTLAAWQAKGRAVPVLWQHDAYDPIGVTTSITEDDKGLRVTAQLLVDDVQRAREAHALARAGALGGLSIGFTVPMTASDGNDSIVWDEERRANIIREVRLWEYSLVTFPANDQAVITSVKQAPEWALELTGTLRELRDTLHARDDAEMLRLLREVRESMVSKTARPDRAVEYPASDALAAALRQANDLLRAKRNMKEGSDA